MGIEAKHLAMFFCGICQKEKYYHLQTLSNGTEIPYYTICHRCYLTLTSTHLEEIRDTFDWKEPISLYTTYSLQTWQNSMVSNEFCRISRSKNEYFQGIFTSFAIDDHQKLVFTEWISQQLEPIQYQSSFGFDLITVAISISKCYYYFTDRNRQFYPRYPTCEILRDLKLLRQISKRTNLRKYFQVCEMIKRVIKCFEEHCGLMTLYLNL